VLIYYKLPQLKILRLIIKYLILIYTNLLGFWGFGDHGTKHEGEDFRIIMLVDILKSAVKPFAKNWNCRTYKPREIRKLIKIKDW